MPTLVDLATAKAHLRVTYASEDALIDMLLGAAEGKVQSFLGRRVYPTEDDAVAAREAAPGLVQAAATAYEAAMAAAALLEPSDERTLAEDDALAVYRSALDAAQADRRAMALTNEVRTAVLLTLAHLFAERGDGGGTAAVGMPQAAREFLWPARERAIA